MNATTAVFKREFNSYFSSPLAFIFIFLFLALAGTFTFFLGGFYPRGQADLLPFFNYHPWLYLFLVPALSMRTWAEERKTGSIELLLTLAISVKQAVLGKFLAAWVFVGLALALSFPLWLTVNYLGAPDNGAIAAAYLGSWLMAGSFLAISSAMSACTDNQVMAFILSLVICFLVIVAGTPLVLDAFSQWAPNALLDAIANVSALTHFQSISRGVLDFRDIAYFAILMMAFLAATALIVNQEKSA